MEVKLHMAHTMVGASAMAVAVAELRRASKYDRRVRMPLARKHGAIHCAQSSERRQGLDLLRPKT